MFSLPLFPIHYPKSVINRFVFRVLVSMSKTIFLAIDSVEGGERIRNFAVSIIQPHDTVIVFNSYPTVGESIGESLRAVYRDMIHKVDGHNYEKARQMVTSLAEKLPKTCRKRALICCGEAKESMVQQIEQRKPNVVILGGLGSTSLFIMANIKCPVTIVP
jgi:nucleotide-binding universal stress UspA family protein